MFIMNSISLKAVTVVNIDYDAVFPPSYSNWTSVRLIHMLTVNKPI